MISSPGYGKVVSVRFNKKDTERDTRRFLSERFRVFFPDHNQCTLLGSTSLYMTNEKHSLYLKEKLNKQRSGNHLVCDSFRFSPALFSDGYQCLAQRTAVADGLGYEEKDPVFNRSVATVSNELSRLWVENSIPLSSSKEERRKSLIDSAAEVNRSLPTEYSQHSPTCSLASGALEYKDGKWVGQFANIGDGMIVIIDGHSLNVKDIIPAAVRHRTRGNYSPNGVQELLGQWKEEVQIQELNIPMQEGDVVVYMTDGVYSGFPLETTLSDETEESWGESHAIFRYTTIVKDSIEKTIAPLMSKESVTAFDIANTILEQQTEHYLREYHETRTLLKTIQADVKKDSAISLLTLEDYLKLLENKDSKFKRSLEEYLASAGKHDGVEFHIKIAQVCDLQRILETQEYGDCTTISVIQVPCYEEELIREYLRTKNSEILEVIAKTITLEQGMAYVDKLFRNYYSPISFDSEGVILKKLKIFRQFSLADLEQLKCDFHKVLMHKLEEKMTSLSLLHELPKEEDSLAGSSTVVPLMAVRGRKTDKDNSAGTSHGEKKETKPTNIK